MTIHTSEDCLYLNIWTPKLSSSARLPVMVFFFGGSFSWGGTSLAVYDGGRIVKRHDVVIVTVNYRLGPMGFTGGNFGLLDQRAALQFVRDNIAGFGGDPNSVTIWGESAGKKKEKEFHFRSTNTLSFSCFQVLLLFLAIWSCPNRGDCLNAQLWRVALLPLGLPSLSSLLMPEERSLSNR